MKKLKISFEQQQALARYYYDLSIESCAEKDVLDDYESLFEAISSAKNDGSFCYLSPEIFDRIIDDLIFEVTDGR